MEAQHALLGHLLVYLVVYLSMPPENTKGSSNRGLDILPQSAELIREKIKADPPQLQVVLGSFVQRWKLCLALY